MQASCLFLIYVRASEVSYYNHNHSVNIPWEGGNRSTRRKPAAFGIVLTNSFHRSVMSREQLER